MSDAPAGIFQRFRAAIRHSLAARLLTIAVVSVFGLVLMGWIAHAQFNAQLLRLLIDPELESVADDLIGNAGPGLNNDLILRDLPSENLFVRTDADRLVQVFINLISNARKYCDATAPDLARRTFRSWPKQIVVPKDRGRGKLPRMHWPHALGRTARGPQRVALGCWQSCRRARTSGGPRSRSRRRRR